MHFGIILMIVLVKLTKLVAVGLALRAYFKILCVRTYVIYSNYFGRFDEATVKFCVKPLCFLPGIKCITPEHGMDADAVICG